MLAFVQMLKDIVHQQIISSTQIGNGKFRENYLKWTVRNGVPMIMQNLYLFSFSNDILQRFDL